MIKLFIISGACGCALSILLGAFGAHLLENQLIQGDFEIYETASRYLFYHSIGLILIGILESKFNSPLIGLSGKVMLSGMILFTGSLYLLLIINTTWLGLVTPFGGTLLIASWILLAIGILKAGK